MRIAVCIKQVPDVEGRLQVAADGAWIDESTVDFDDMAPGASSLVPPDSILEPEANRPGAWSGDGRHSASANFGFSITRRKTTFA